MPIRGYVNYGTTTISADPGTGQTALFNSLMQSFSLNAEDENTDVEAYPISGSGVLETVYNYLTKRQYTLEMGNVFDWACLQMMVQMHAITTTSLVRRKVYTATVPTSSPYEVAIAGLTGLAVTDVHVSILTSETNVFSPLEVVAIAPAAADEVHADIANTKLVFDSSQAGKAFSYQLNEIVSNKQTIGVEAATTVLDTVSFDGTMRCQTAPNSIEINIPKMSRTGGFTLEAGSDTNTIQFRPIVDGSNYSAVRYILAA